jgi:hypothetical protein
LVSYWSIAAAPAALALIDGGAIRDGPELHEVSIANRTVTTTDAVASRNEVER